MREGVLTNEYLRTTRCCWHGGYGLVTVRRGNSATGTFELVSCHIRFARYFYLIERIRAHNDAKELLTIACFGKVVLGFISCRRKTVDPAMCQRIVSPFQRDACHDSGAAQYDFLFCALTLCKTEQYFTCFICTACCGDLS